MTKAELVQYIQWLGTDILAALFLKIFPDLFATSLTHHAGWTILLKVNRTSRLTKQQRASETARNVWR
jgi:hypothetical protein